MSPVLKGIIQKATAPFTGVDLTDIGRASLQEQEELQSLCFFPTLPRVRSRRFYEADTDRKASIYTKKNSGHPSLLPGVFTLFCHHGMLHYAHSWLKYSAYVYTLLQLYFFTGICYGFQAMRLHESPNTPFTILYERSQEGTTRQCTV